MLFGLQSRRSFPDEKDDMRDCQRSYSQRYSSTPGDLGFRNIASGRENLNVSNFNHYSNFNLFHLQLRTSFSVPSATRVSFPSPCITSTHQLSDRSSYPSSPFSHNGSPIMTEEEQALCLLKQFYLEAILEIDPNHPLGINRSFVSNAYDVNIKT